MTLAVLDAYAYVKQLKEAGFSEEQAEAQVNFQAQVLQRLLELDPWL